MVGRLEAAGVNVSKFHFSPSSKMQLASTLLHSVNTGAVELYPAEGLRDELVALRVVQKDAGMFAFDHAPGEHDDRAVALSLMLREAIARGGAGWADTVSYVDEPSEPVIRRGELTLTGEQYLDETGETDAWGEPFRRPPPGWSAVEAPDW